MDGYAVRAAEARRDAGVAGAPRPRDDVRRARRPRSRRAGPVLRHRDRRTASRGRRRRRHGGAHDAGPGAKVLLSAVAQGQHVGRRGADIAIGDTVLREGMVFTAARVGALAALGLARSRSTPAARVPHVHGKRDRGAGTPARRRPHLRHQPLHAAGDRGGARWRAAGRARRARHPRRAADALDTARRRWRRPARALGRQLGGRSRPAGRRGARAGRGPVPRHRGEAGKAHAARPPRVARCCSACRATRRPACRTPTSC